MERLERISCNSHSQNPETLSLFAETLSLLRRKRKAPLPPPPTNAPSFSDERLCPFPLRRNPFSPSPISAPLPPPPTNAALSLFAETLSLLRRSLRRSLLLRRGFPTFFPLFLPLPKNQAEPKPSSFPLRAENPSSSSSSFARNLRRLFLLLLRQESPRLLLRRTPKLAPLLLRQESPLKMPKYYTTNTPKCRCGLLAKIITSWTADNPGRRFAICSLYENEGGCGFWAWIDDEICSRSTQVIPGLLRRINKLEADAKSAENTIKKLKTENCKLLFELDKTKKIIRHIFVVIMCWII
ncbi:uncharacterized protein LOC141827046 [Curcuma longa]|uniref:uncharacterized protein LOC141827046 n=1 Tax=Curcuma longa TaxID=136217 RepID=UPI003D9E9191